jgi:hypothetical protein
VASATRSDRRRRLCGALASVSICSGKKGELLPLSVAKERGLDRMKILLFAAALMAIGLVALSRTSRAGSSW